jgi:hypothetical protein
MGCTAATWQLWVHMATGGWRAHGSWSLQVGRARNYPGKNLLLSGRPVETSSSHIFDETGRRAELEHTLHMLVTGKSVHACWITPSSSIRPYRRTKRRGVRQKDWLGGAGMDGTAHPAPVLPLRACVAQTRHNIIIITGAPHILNRY